MDVIAEIVSKLADWWMGTTPTERIWLGLGLGAQLMFSMRFLVQWIASERAGESIVPEVFWYFSLAGGAMLFAYATYRLDPVFMLGQGMGLIIYARNIDLIWRKKRGDTDADKAGKVTAE